MVLFFAAGVLAFAEGRPSPQSRLPLGKPSRLGRGRSDGSLLYAGCQADVRRSTKDATKHKRVVYPFDRSGGPGRAHWAVFRAEDCTAGAAGAPAVIVADVITNADRQRCAGLSKRCSN